ncbi:hypothetical protein P700755_002345 [Psychroflexus torquis ATCC 700755]|uniref:Uncharacterized protein n=1 Tax=Psychroflexus torquis (strain ATCC 700755 / CIP 106069 / ACAM 623) TaxID=313595 RepID=K4IFG1_PSYTT|nr:hypothetical protein [Psychroflexus torquis]AFU69124.1 hypothetical protein P700755_002345 [Psychroflexus torquis ATCC 700755]
MKIIILITFILSLSNVFAQDNPTSFNITESESFHYDKKIDGILAMKTLNTGVTGVVLEHEKRNVLDKPYFFFDIFDKNLIQIFTKKVEIDKNESYVGDLYYNGILKVFTVYQPNKKERTVYVHQLDINHKTYKRVKLFDARIQKKQNLFATKNSHVTNFSISPNNTYFAVATDNISKKMNDYDIRVFDVETNELIYKKNYQKDKERGYEHNDLYIDNDAVVYSVGKRFLSKRERVEQKRGSMYKFVLNKITETDSQAIDITLDQKHVQSLSITDINDEMHLLGFYSERNENLLKGGCNFTIDLENFRVMSKKFDELPKQVYDDMYNERASKRKNEDKKELKNFNIDHVITTAQGDSYLIAEEFYITTSYAPNGQFGGAQVTTYHYDNILILKFNSEGNLDWGRSIFKVATSPSYNVFYKDEKLHVLLNSGKNLKEKKDGRVKVSKGFFESTALYDVEISQNGEVSYNKIQDNKGETTYQPFYGTYELNRFLMPSDGGKEKRFMILE